MDKNSDPKLPPLELGDNLANERMFNILTDTSFGSVLGSEHMEVRDLGFADNGDGGISMVIFRSTGIPMSAPSIWHMHDIDYHLGYIIRGWAEYEFEGLGRRRVEAGTAIHHAVRNRMRVIELSDDFEGLWIKRPHVDKVAVFAPVEGEGQLQKVWLP